MKGNWEFISFPEEAKYCPLAIFNYGGAGEAQQEIYVSAPKTRNGLGVVWIHGGGLTAGGREVPDLFFQRGFTIFEPRYRLSPGHPGSVAVGDAAAAVAWVWNRRAEYGIDRLFVGGMSAGSYLAAMIGMDRKRLGVFGIDCRELAGLCLISGQMTTHFQLKADLRYPGSQFEPVIDTYAPMAHLAADLAPILFVTGESGLDIPARPEENAFCAASLRALGHPMVRCFSIPGADHPAAFDRCEPYIADFLEELK